MSENNTPSWRVGYDALPEHAKEAVRRCASHFQVPLMAAFFRARELGMLAPPPDIDQFVPTHRHIGRNSVYRTLTHKAHLQWSGNRQAEETAGDLTIYQDQTGEIYVRPAAEVRDGRFEVIHPSDPVLAGNQIFSVKPLVWKETFRDGDFFHLTAMTPFGWYEVRNGFLMDGHTVSPSWKASHINGEMRVASVEEGQSACFFNHQQLVMSTISVGAVL